MADPKAGPDALVPRFQLDHVLNQGEPPRQSGACLIPTTWLLCGRRLTGTRTADQAGRTRTDACLIPTTAAD